MARRKHKKKPLPIRLGEVPSDELNRQVGGTVEEVIDRHPNGKILTVRHRLRCECMLDAYLLRELIEKEEHQAGMKFRLAWLRAREGLKVRDRFSSGRSLNYSDSMRVIPESERILKEADKVLTPAQKHMVIRVCAENRKAGGAYKLETFNLGLFRLAQRWGYRKRSDKFGRDSSNDTKTAR